MILFGTGTDQHAQCAKQKKREGEKTGGIDNGARSFSPM